MSLTDAPAIITQLATQLAACAGWSGESWYPEVPDLGSATLPAAALSEMNRRYTPYAAGASGLPSGDLEIKIYSAASIGVLESLGRTIIDQLLAQQSGIPFRPGDCGLCSDQTSGMEAAGDSIRSITINLSYGLDA